MARRSYMIGCLCLLAVCTTTDANRRGTSALAQQNTQSVGKQYHQLHKLVVEMLSDVRKSATDTDWFTAFLTRMQADPLDLFLLGLKIYGSYTDTLTYWTALDFNNLFDEMKLNWWAIFKQAASDEYQATPEYAAAQAAWESSCVTMLGMADAANAAFEAGDVTAWEPVINEGISGITAAFTAGAPASADSWDTVNSVLLALVAGWKGFVTQDVGSAFGSVWNGTRDVLKDLPLYTDNADYKSIVDQSSIVMEKIAAEIDAYTLNKDTGGFDICWKNFYTVESEPVSKCYEGFKYDAATTSCVGTAVNGADCEPHCQVNAQCSAFCPANKRYCCKKNDPEGPSACAGATYVDFSFTEGTAEDYYQCVSEVQQVVPSSSLLQQEKQEKHEKALAKRRSNTSSTVSRSAVKSRRATTSLDASFGGKVAASNTRTTVTVPFGTHQPVCDINSAYSQALVGYEGNCFQECQASYTSETVDVDGVETPTNKCKTVCSGTHAADGVFSAQGLEGMFGIEVCGKSSAVITLANGGSLDVLTTGFTGIINFATAWATNGALTDTEVQTVVDATAVMINQFNMPYCEVA